MRPSSCWLEARYTAPTSVTVQFVEVGSQRARAVTHGPGQFSHSETKLSRAPVGVKTDMDEHLEPAIGQQRHRIAHLAPGGKETAGCLSLRVPSLILPPC